MLHGSEGDGGPLGQHERDLYESVLAPNVSALRDLVRPGDIVLLHDPQTAGMVEGLLGSGAHVVWRCHVGLDITTEVTDRVWAFLRPDVERADALIFSRMEYVPDWVDTSVVRVIPPSLDPFSAKNIDLPRADLEATLRQAGLVDIAEDHGSLDFVRRDGSEGVVRRHSGLIAGDQIVPAGRPSGAAGQPLGPAQGHVRGAHRLRRPPVSDARRRPPHAGRTRGVGSQRRPGGRRGARRVSCRSGGHSPPRPGSVCTCARCPWTTSPRTPGSSTRSSATRRWSCRRAWWRASASP